MNFSTITKLNNKFTVWIGLGVLLIVGSGSLVAFSEMKVTPSDSTSVISIPSFSEDTVAIPSSDTRTKTKEMSPLEYSRMIKFDNGFYDKIQEKIETKKEFHKCLDLIDSFSTDTVFVYDLNLKINENDKIVNLYEKIKDKPKCQNLLVAEETEEDKTIGHAIDKTDYHSVIILINNHDGTNRDKKVISAEKKGSLVESINNIVGVKDIYVAKRLSFVSAKISVTEIPKLADNEDIVLRIGDGEKELISLSQDMTHLKGIIGATNVGSPPFSYTGAGVRVAIIDPHLVNTHPDLDGVVAQSDCITSSCTLSFEEIDVQTHSTKIAGIIAGRDPDNMKGIAPGSVIQAIKINEESDDFVRGLDHAFEMGSTITNISMHVDADCTSYDSVSIILDEAVDEGMVITTAAGNFSKIVDTSCGYNVISVGGVFDIGSYASAWPCLDTSCASARGPGKFGTTGATGYLPPRLKPELVAPSVDIMTLHNATTPYAQSSGTSFASPQVAGAAALIEEAVKQFGALETKVALLLGANWDNAGIIPTTSTYYPVNASKYENEATIDDFNNHKISYTLNRYGFGLLNITKSLIYATEGINGKDNIICGTTPHLGSQEFTIHLDPTDTGKQVKVILSWLSQPIRSLSFDGTSSFQATPVSNLDLEIYDPNNNKYSSSSSQSQNNEFVIFYPTIPGDYKIKVKGTKVPFIINKQEYVLGSTIPITLPLTLPQIDPTDQVFVNNPFNPGFEMNIWLTGSNNYENRCNSFYLNAEPPKGKVSTPVRYEGGKALVTYHSNLDFDGTDIVIFKPADGKYTNANRAQATIVNERITPNSVHSDGFSSTPSFLDVTASQSLLTSIQQTVTIFTPPAQPISSLYAFSKVPSSLSFENSGKTSFVSLAKNSGKLINFTDPGGLDTANIRVVAQNTTTSDSVIIGYEFAPPILPTITINDVTQIEGNSGTSNFVFTVTRSSNTDAISVNYSTADFTASSPSDYTAIPTATLNFAADGPLTQTITVSVAGDTTIESYETFFVNLVSCSGCTIIDNLGVGAITNDDSTSSLPTITINDVTLPEGNSGTSNFVFTVTRSSNTDAISVNYSTADFTASSPSDYTSTTGTLNFAAGGPLTQTISVPVLGDTTIESYETFFVNLASCSGCTIIDNLGVGAIINDESTTLPTITINDVTLQKIISPNSAVFTVTRSSNTAAISVNYSTTDITANTPSDYTVTSGTLNFPAGGPLTKNISVPVLAGDGFEMEPTETFSLNLSNCVGCTITDNQGLGTILLMGSRGYFYDVDINDATLVEGNSGTSNFIFTVTRANYIYGAASVDYTIVDGTATTPSDYTASSGTLNFPSGGSTTQTASISISVAGDTIPEPNETFFVLLSNCVNCKASDFQGKGTITNDDGLQTIRIDDATLVEENSGVRNYQFTVSRDNNADPLSVNYSTADDSAIASSDYTASSGTLNLAAGGQITQTITVPMLGDNTVESIESFSVNLSNCNGCTITDSQGLGIITNDDYFPITTPSPLGGTYATTQSVTLSADEPATIYYTTNGSTPTTSSTVYSSPISISATTTLKFFAKDTAGNSESVKTQVYTISSGSPITHMSDTTANTGQSVYSGRQIHAEYVSSTSQLVGDTIDTITIKLKKSGSPTGTAEIGVFNTDLSVKKSFGTKDVSTLTTSYTDYTFSLSGQTYQIQSGDRIGVKYTGGDSSTNISIMRDTDAADPFDGTNSYHVYYQTSWSSFTTNDLYMILVGNSGQSDTTAPIITVTPAGGLYSTPQSVTVTTNEAATIYYTTDGFTPTTSDAVYTTPISISATTTLKFLAKDTAGNEELISMLYLIDTIAPTTTPSPLGGTYATTQSVTLSADEPATIYYTTNGSTPTTSSTVYSSPISISATTTLKFFAKDIAGNSESVKTQVYTISSGSPITHMSDTTANTGQSVYSGRQIHAEYVSSTSQLIGDTIDTITIKLKKSGSPTGTTEIGVFNTDLSVKKLFGTKDVSTLTTSYTDYMFSLNGQTYQIQSGDRIGVKYTGGDSSTNISIMRDTDSADPFDGTNSYHVYYQTSWSSFTANDLYMILVQSNP
jgi:DNA-directed RNA polymerase subunit H (RpoH/RPB5)